MTQNQTVGDRLAAKIKDRAKANGRDSLDDLRRFALERVLAGPPVERGIALAFGPGLAAEGFGFRSVRDES